MPCSYIGVMERLAKRTSQFGTAAVVVCLLGASGFAQITNPGAANPPAAPANAQPVYTPLTGSDRLQMFGRGVFGPMALATGAFSAAFGQWRDRPHEWPQGAEGYGMRFGSGYAQRIARETLTLGSTSLIYQDNRYFRSTDTRNMARLRHAIVSTFTARREDGSTTFGYCRIGSMLGASFIARTWQPPSTGSVNSAFQNFGTAVGVAMGINVAREFLPKKFRLVK
jgi:hypothetical protein